MSDDQTWANFTRDLMPNVFGEIVDSGVLFNHAYVDTALCCPSRSEILTGLYEHHTGMDSNFLRLDRPTLVAALHDLGYRTGLAGKYLNGHPCQDVRPEFDQWICVGGGGYTLKDPTLYVNGVPIRFSGYTTDILADYTVDFISTTPADQPFFAMYTPPSPHLPANDDRCYGADIQPLRPPSFDEDTQAGGKPLYQQRPALSPNEIAGIDDSHQLMTQTVPCLDTSIATVLSALGSREENTLVVFLSDQGYVYGEHRWRGKSIAYEEAIHVPLAVRYPPMIQYGHPFVSDALVQNVDIAVTIADILDIQWQADGLSLVPILTGEAASVRDAALLQHCQGRSFPCTEQIIPYGQSPAPSFNGLVTPNFKYVENITGEKELYDLSADPYELTNLAADSSYQDDLARLAGDLADLLAPPPPDTTIVTGPQGPIDSRLVAFTFFSQSRFATYQCRLDQDGIEGAWSPCNLGRVILGPLADGNYLFNVMGTDEGGVADLTPAIRSFSIASTGPDVTITSGPPAHTRDRTASFAFTSQTPDVTFKCQMSLYGDSGTWETCFSGVTYLSLSDGLHLFQVKSIDGTGAESSPPAQWLVNVDNVGPKFSFNVAPSSPTRSTDATFSFQPDEPIIGPINCKLDGLAPVDCSGGAFSASDLLEGKHSLLISATDELAIKAKTILSWTIDQTPPVLTIEGPSPYTNQAAATFDLFADEPLARESPTSCALDGQNLVRGPTNSTGCPARRFVIDELSDGAHTLFVAGVDEAGNVSSSVSWSWTVDTIRPVTTITSGPANPTFDTSATFEFSVQDATPVDFTCSLDGDPAAPCDSGVTYSDLAVGAHRFSVRGTDAAGNIGAPAVWNWRIVSLAPGSPR